MQQTFAKILGGYNSFRGKYALGDKSVMHHLSDVGQRPQIMVVACCDSRVDPAVILQCGPGELFVTRNVANIVPPFVKDKEHHGTSAALEFGIRFLNVKHLILLGHSQCGGIHSLMNHEDDSQNDFISNWVSIVRTSDCSKHNSDDYAKLALQQSYRNSMTFPWIKDAVEAKKLVIHRWFFDIKSGEILAYLEADQSYTPLDEKHF